MKLVSFAFKMYRLIKRKYLSQQSAVILHNVSNNTDNIMSKLNSKIHKVRKTGVPLINERHIMADGM